MLDSQTKAVAEALRALLDVQAELKAAEKALEQVRTEARQARTADQNARAAYKVARKAEERTKREIATASQHIEKTKAELGVMARVAYRTGGTIAGLSVVFETDTPADFAETYTGVRTLMRAGDTTLGELAQYRAQLVDRQDQLSRLREERMRRATEASETLAAKEAAERAAETAQARLDKKVAAHNEALRAAEQAWHEDYERYQELLKESRSLESVILDHAKRLESLEASATGAFVRPGTGMVTSEYGPRLHPILGYVKQHTGVDLAQGDGFIYAADSGVVVEAEWNNAYGNLVIIDHGAVDGRRISTLYAHQPDLMVSPGESVRKGQVIGRVGSTGYSTGPHLHFEVRADGEVIDPWQWIKDAPGPSSLRR